MRRHPHRASVKLFYGSNLYTIKLPAHKLTHIIINTTGNAATYQLITRLIITTPSRLPSFLQISPGSRSTRGATGGSGDRTCTTRQLTFVKEYRLFIRNIKCNCFFNWPRDDGNWFFIDCTANRIVSLRPDLNYDFSTIDWIALCGRKWLGIYARTGFVL